MASVSLELHGRLAIPRPRRCLRPHPQMRLRDGGGGGGEAGGGGGGRECGDDLCAAGRVSGSSQMVEFNS